MNKLKNFLVGSVLLIIVFTMVLVTALLYRANERMSVKTYIFQMNNLANERVGEIQDINDISVNDLRNRLIKKYVSEYFKVIPGETDVTNRPILQKLGPVAFKQWEKDEAKTIADMSAKKMFRMVRVQDDGIATITKMKNPNYKTNDLAESVYYAVRYYMYTWEKPNSMEIQPTYDQGTIYIQAKFKPGIKPDVNVRKYLEEGKDPAALIMFEVLNVRNKDNI